MVNTEVFNKLQDEMQLCVILAFEFFFFGEIFA